MRDDPEYNVYGIDHTHYEELNNGKNLSSRFLKKSHLLLENCFSTSQNFDTVLELGAGSLPHYNYVKHGFKNYFITDIIERKILLEKITNVNKNIPGSIFFKQEDAVNPSFEEMSFDRIVASHLLEHLPSPHIILKRWYNLLKPGGILSIILPCNPGLLWRLGRCFGPRRRAQQLNIAYDYWMAREHINSIFNLVSLIQYYFPNRVEHWYPSRFCIPDINLFYTVHIRRTNWDQ